MTLLDESATVLATKGIAMSNIYNIDETRLRLGTSKEGEVIVNTMLKARKKVKLAIENDVDIRPPIAINWFWVHQTESWKAFTTVEIGYCQGASTKRYYYHTRRFHVSSESLYIPVVSPS